MTAPTISEYLKFAATWKVVEHKSNTTAGAFTRREKAQT